MSFFNARRNFELWIFAPKLSFSRDSNPRDFLRVSSRNRTLTSSYTLANYHSNSSFSVTTKPKIINHSWNKRLQTQGRIIMRNSWSKSAAVVKCILANGVGFCIKSCNNAFVVKGNSRSFPLLIAHSTLVKTALFNFRLVRPLRPQLANFVVISSPQ